MIPRKRINKVRVKAISKENISLDHIKGSELFEDVYPNVFLLSKKNQGKTTVAFNILKQKANKNTTVIFFVGQLYKDQSYKVIVNYLKRKNIPYVLNNSIMDDEGQDQLRELLDHLKSSKRMM